MLPGTRLGDGEFSDGDPAAQAGRGGKNLPEQPTGILALPGLAVSSIYGIDILEDNVTTCRERLFEIADARYTALFKGKAKDACRRSLCYILKKNIIWDALTPKTVGENPVPIVFCEWSLVNGSKIKRRDFVYKELIEQSSLRELPLFSDAGDQVFIPSPIADLPPVHFFGDGKGTVFLIV